QVHLELAHFVSHQKAGVGNELADIPMAEKTCGSFAESEHPADDLFELIDLFPDNLLVLVSWIAFRVLKVQGAEEKFDDGERITDLVGDLRREKPQGSEALALAEPFLAVENTGVEAGVLRGHGRKTREGL